MLLPELEPLGKALLRGTWKDMASADWKAKSLKKELQKMALKDVVKECCSFSSSKNPSLLKKVGMDELGEFSHEGLWRDG